MSIPLVIGLLLPVFLSPIWTFGLYLRVFEGERAQIAADNAAIRVGRNDREWLNYLVKVNQLLRALEIMHHPLHLCARSGAATTICTEKDIALEKLILEIQTEATQFAEKKWKLGRVLIMTEVNSLECKTESINRDRGLPARKLQCPICRLATQWEITKEIATTINVVHSFPVQSTAKLIGRSLQDTKKWQFKLLFSEDSRTSK